MSDRYVPLIVSLHVSFVVADPRVVISVFTLAFSTKRHIEQAIRQNITKIAADDTGNKQVTKRRGGQVVEFEASWAVENTSTTAYTSWFPFHIQRRTLISFLA